MSTAAPKPVLPPLLSWAIHDYLQEGQRKQVSRGWLTATRHVLRLLLLASNDIPVDVIGKHQIDAFWHAFRYWPSSTSRRRDLIGCTDAQILTIGFIEAKPAPSDNNYLLAQKTFRHFFAWLLRQGAIVQAPVELHAIVKHKLVSVPSSLSSKVHTLAHGARRAHRLPVGGKVALTAWKRPDSSPLVGFKLGYCIDKFIRAQRVDGTGIARLRSYVSALRVLFAALDDMPVADISEVHLKRFRQLYHWWPQNRSKPKIDMDALPDSRLLDIGRQELAKPPRPSAIVKAEDDINNFLDWAYREGARAVV